MMASLGENKKQDDNAALGKKLKIRLIWVILKSHGLPSLLVNPIIKHMILIASQSENMFFGLLILQMRFSSFTQKCIQFNFSWKILLKYIFL
jgi:hypothetical protein